MVTLQRTVRTNTGDQSSSSAFFPSSHLSSIWPSFSLLFSVLTPFEALQRGLFHKLITERHGWAMGAEIPMLGKYSLQGKYLLENCGGREAAFQETRPREKYKDGRNN